MNNKLENKSKFTIWECTKLVRLILLQSFRNTFYWLINIRNKLFDIM